MGQAEVFEILKENYPKWLTSSNVFELLLCKGITIQISTVRQNLSRLHKHGDINKRMEGYYNTIEYRISKEKIFKKIPIECK